MTCECGHEYNCHALDEVWEDGSCRMYRCSCKDFKEVEE